jgi:hypothetical protein
VWSDQGEQRLDGSGIFIARYGPCGELAWHRVIGDGGDSTTGTGIAVLPDDSILVTGAFEESATFGAGEPNETTLESVGEADAFIAKLSPGGCLLWAVRAGGPGHVFSNAIAAQEDGSVWITGRFKGRMTFGVDEPNETSLAESGGDAAMFLARYNPGGTVAWATKVESGLIGAGLGVSVLSDGSSLMCGVFDFEATFGSAEQNHVTLSGRNDPFVAKYTPNGEVTWAQKITGESYDYGRDIAPLPDGSALVTGEFFQSAVFGHGEANETEILASSYGMYLARYNPDGSFASVVQAHGQGATRGWGVSRLLDGSAAVTGTFSGDVIFGQGEANETVLSSQWGQDVFVAKYNGDGTLAWARQAGGKDSSGAADPEGNAALEPRVFGDTGFAVVGLKDGSLLVAGGFDNEATFGPGEPNEIHLKTESETDLFLAKLAP